VSSADLGSAGPVVEGPAGSAPAGPAPAGLFVRKSSGLVREMGLRDAVSVALSGINPATVVAIFFISLVFASNADLSWPYIVAGAVMIPLTFTYAHLVAAMPRSGGDFVYLGRIFHPIAGAAVGGALLLFFMLNLGANSVFVGQLFLPQLAQVAGSALHWHALTTFSGTLGSSRAAWFVSSGLIVLVGCLIAMRGAHALSRAMFWCFVAGVLAVLVVIFEALTHSNSEFQAAYNHHTAPGAYAGVVAAAKQAHIKTGDTFSGFLRIMPYAATGFWGFTITNFPAGELKRAGRTYLAATLGGLAVGVVVLLAGWLAIRHLAGLHFMQSAAALSTQDPAKFGKLTGGGASTLTPFYADVVAGDPVTRLVMAGGFVIGGIMFPLAMVLISSRLMFALSFDRLLPAKLADVSPRHHAPVKALAVCAVAGLAFVALIVFSTGYVRLSRNGVIVWAVLMTIAGVAGMALPFRRRELFDGAPKVISGTWFGLPPVVVISAFVVLSQGALAYYAATNTAISQGYDAGSIAYLAGTALIGVVLYAVSRTYLKRRKGIDLGLAMRELPPE
jgi:APA family basic amino acid/polyamine antiporter